jgi:hypothetical protein
MPTEGLRDLFPLAGFLVPGFRKKGSRLNRLFDLPDEALRSAGLLVVRFRRPPLDAAPRDMFPLLLAGEDFGRVDLEAFFVSFEGLAAMVVDHSSAVGKFTALNNRINTSRLSPAQRVCAPL